MSRVNGLLESFDRGLQSVSLFVFVEGSKKGLKFFKGCGEKMQQKSNVSHKAPNIYYLAL